MAANYAECPERTLGNLILCRVSPGRHLAKQVFAECLPLTLDKVYLFFSFLPKFLWYVLQYIDLHVQFLQNYQSVFYNY
jgi:hypothetical protein